MIPCENCITLGICKGLAIQYLDKKSFTHSTEVRINNTIFRLAKRCSLLYEYCQISEVTSLNVGIERVLLDLNPPFFRKALVKKLIGVEEHFNLSYLLSQF